MLKKIVLIASLLILITGAAFGQTEVSGLLPKNARAMGMGGAFRVFSTGYDTFFGNPAGFASKYGSLTIADVATWAYLKPTQQNIDRVLTLVEGSATTSDMISYANDLITQNGLGFGASLGLGWAGKGFGVGATMVTDEIITGSSLLGATLSSQTQLNGIVGLALPIKLGFLRVQLGANARAFYLLKSPANGWTVGNILTTFMSNPNAEPMVLVQDLPIYGGYGLAFDGGLTLGVGPFMLGAMVRDYGFAFNMDETGTIGDIANSMMVPTAGTTPYLLTPSYAVGAGLAFDFGFLAPSVYLEAEDPLSLIETGVDGIWNKIHAGAELELLQFIKLRAGLNKGWVSVGAGLDLIIFELDAALFTEELGSSPGDFGRTGLSVQAAFRF